MAKSKAKNNSENIVITQKELDNVQLKDVELKTTLSTSFDAHAKKNGDAITVDLTIKMDNADLTDVIERAVADRRISINSMLKKNAVDTETYQKYLKDNNKKFVFTYGEIGGSTRNGSSLHTGMKAVNKMSPEELEMFKAYLAKQEA